MKLLVAVSVTRMLTEPFEDQQVRAAVKAAA
jgi:hypothetical protein